MSNETNSDHLHHAMALMMARAMRQDLMSAIKEPEGCTCPRHGTKAQRAVIQLFEQELDILTAVHKEAVKRSHPKVPELAETIEKVKAEMVKFRAAYKILDD